LRVSLTDRVTFAASIVCDGEPPMPRKRQLLSYEEIEYVCGIFVELGIEKDPADRRRADVRRDIEDNYSELAALKSKVCRLALTTNAIFCPTGPEGLPARDSIGSRSVWIVEAKRVQAK